MNVDQIASGGSGESRQAVDHPGLNERRLEIGIIGAGIAGLGAAIALGRIGHDVELFERSRFAREVGLGIHSCPNATRILRRWGFDFERANADLFGYGTLMRADTLEPTRSGTHENWESKYGAKGYFLHRVDLHSGLKNLAQDPGSHPSFRAAKIRLTAEVVDIDCEAGIIELADGQMVRKDVIIIADGVHSRLAHKICDDISPVARTGESIFRFLVPTEKLRTHPTTAAMFPVAGPSGSRAAFLDDRRMLWYPCRNGTEQSCAVIRADEPYSTSVENRHVEASKEDLMLTCKAFHPALVEMCNQAENVKLWPLLFRRPNANWTKGRAVLIGDAAHPMLPYQQQGSAQGLEDGAALGVLLSHIPAPSVSEPLEAAGDTTSLKGDASEILTARLTERLQLFQDIRKNRTAAIQVFSKAGQDAKQIIRDARPYVNGKVPTTQEEFYDFIFGHDVVEECVRALKAFQDPENGAGRFGGDIRSPRDRCNL